MKRIKNHPRLVAWSVVFVLAGLFWVGAQNLSVPAPGGSDTDAIHDNVAGEISAIANKATPVGADYVLIEDSAAANAKKHVLISAITALGGGGVTVLSVSNIDDPSTELNAIAGSAAGELRLCHQVVAGKDEWTLYSWDNADSGSESVPHTVDGSSGLWTAISGRYQNGEADILSSADITFGLGDTAGANKISITDSAATEVLSLMSNGTALLAHTATQDDEATIEIDVDAAGYADVKAIDIAYITGAVAAGDEVAGVLVEIDETGSAGGRVSAFEVISTDEGSATTHALFTAATVNPIIQLAGTFANMDSLLVNAVDQLAALSSGGAGNVSVLVANSDTITIGNAAKFEEIEIIINTASSNPGVKPTFAYSTGGTGFTDFVPVDGTNGFRQSGGVVWLDGDIPSWTTNATGDYEIRITRTQASLGTTPILDEVQILEGTEYSWDSAGSLNINALVLNDSISQKKGDDIDSSDTGSNLDANDTGNYFDVTGTTTVTGIAASWAGTGHTITFQFDGILTLTHHATDFILPGGSNITTAAGDHATFIEYATADWRCTSYQKADGTAVVSSGGGSGLSTAQDKYIPAKDWTSPTTDGALYNETELSNGLMDTSYFFDGASDEYLTFIYKMPRTWDLGQINFSIDWDAASGSGDAVWVVQAQCIDEDDAMNTAFTGGVSVTDELVAVGDGQTADTAALTVSGTPSAGDLLLLRVYRDADDANDTINGIDCKFRGLNVEFTATTSP